MRIHNRSNENRQRLAAIALAFGMTLAAASDWALVAPAQPELPPICAKSETVCRLAVEAIATRRWPIEPGYVECRPAPGCFSPESEVIRGYNDRGQR